MNFKPKQPLLAPMKDRILRIITFINLFIGIPFLIPYGVLSYHAVPALGLAFLGPSAFLAVFVLCTRNHHPRFATYVDFICALGLIGCLIPGWLDLASYRRWLPRGVTMAGTYGTVPLMVSFAIHTYLSLRDIKNLFRAFSGQAPMCPHCHGDLSGVNTRSSRPQHPYYDSLQSIDEEDVEQGPPRDSKESYSPVTMVEADPKPVPSGSKDPRPSTDDESARLV